MSEIKWEYAKNKEPFESVVDKIVAADLLEALQYARRFMDKRDHDIEYVDAAIDRALGKNGGDK